MSRGDREASSGILKHSMRDNYAELGVEEYYRRVGATYRNPHFPGVRSCLFRWMNAWWECERSNSPSNGFTVFDMACGSGEATLAVLEWWHLGRRAFDESQLPNSSDPGLTIQQAAILKRNANKFVRPPPIVSESPRPTILAADPFTAEAYRARTTLGCSSLSFSEIAEGGLSDLLSSSQGENNSGDETADIIPDTPTIDMVICSFALHLIETPSELFALLWELSMKCKWLVIVAPHKKPDIKDGWGWSKWNVETWSECPMTESKGELLQERVHCRIYRSLNL
ncbi:hypothetical protein WOLCODRAFT_98433 [Wolfiporia cocos MD-104 SS10]|uniref:Methyltransferase domain-containing protein n=1 Tax=Wolfiporia cocos (strain MD-104) TaxID=742152 RepID=A0A2H3JVI4_WOLCO|nr:hypothetical protein WOLCODRAFT_98433 [Wolfiporia cocos MD-104 SS10]